MSKLKKRIISFTLFTLLLCGLSLLKVSALSLPEKTTITYCKSSDEGRLLLNWTVKNVDGYEVNLAQNDSFTKNPQTLTYDGTKRKASLTNLPKGINYFVRIRTYNINEECKIYSDWSDITTVKIHAHYYKRTVTTKPTCTENGVYTYTCDCGRYHKMPANKFGHDYEWIHSENGCQEYKCKRCADVLEVKEHNYHLTDKIEPTCSTHGKEIYTCANCGDKKEKEVEKLNHNYAKKVETNSEIIYECTLCHDSYSETKETSNSDIVDESKKIDKEYTIDLGNGETTTVVGHYETEMSNEIFNLLNEYRKENGLYELKTASNALQAASDIRAYELVYKFSHYRPNGKRALTSFTDSTGCCAENIGKYQRSAEEVMQDWKNSPSHNEAMLSLYPRFVAISVFAEKSTTISGKVCYHYYFIQLFGW